MMTELALLVAFKSTTLDSKPGELHCIKATGCVYPLFNAVAH